MNDDNDMVTLEVRMTADDVRGWAEDDNFHPDHPLAAAARRWVEAHDRPERREFVLPVAGTYVGAAIRAVAVEDLQPGDRVAGREVDSVVRDGPDTDVRWTGTFGDGDVSTYGLGTLVVLDGDQ